MVPKPYMDSGSRIRFFRPTPTAQSRSGIISKLPQTFQKLASMGSPYQVVQTLRAQGPKYLGIRAQILQYEWYLGPKPLLFGFLDLYRESQKKPKSRCQSYTPCGLHPPRGHTKNLA